MLRWPVQNARAAVTALWLWHLRRIEQLSYLNPDRTLVIINMQERFLRNIRDPWHTIAAIVEEIRLARQDGCPIVLVEYDDESAGATDPTIKQALIGYETQSCVVRKSNDDGSAQIHHACKTLGYHTAVLRLCGLNVNACVVRTASGLLKLYPQSRVEVVKDACSTYDRRREYLEYWLPSAWRVKLVRLGKRPLSPGAAGV